jgi:hypothetical protein
MCPGPNPRQCKHQSQHIESAPPCRNKKAWTNNFHQFLLSSCTNLDPTSSILNKTERRSTLFSRLHEPCFFLRSLSNSDMEMQEKLNRTPHRTSAAFPQTLKRMTIGTKRGRAHRRVDGQNTHTNRHSDCISNGNRIRVAKRNPYLDKRDRMSSRARAGSRKCWMAKELKVFGAT